MTAPSYEDPVDAIWVAAAARCGLTVVTSREVYASWDGAGELRIADPADRDPDDCVAQLVFHEMCHALVEGPNSLTQRDWGLCNHDERDLVREHATHRVQAALTEPFGLRMILAPTTEHRVYYDALPDDPLEDTPGDPAVLPAREGWTRATSGPWAEALDDALVATAAVARAVAPSASPTSLWSRFRASSDRRADAAGTTDHQAPDPRAPRASPDPR